MRHTQRAIIAQQTPNCRNSSGFNTTRSADTIARVPVRPDWLGRCWANLDDRMGRRSYIRRMAPTNDPAVVSDWIEYVWKAGGTDLLLTADAPPLARIDGAYGPIDKEAILTNAKVDEIAHKVIAADLMTSFDAVHQVDFSLTWRDSVRVRGNCYRQRGATAIALRIIPMQIPTLDDLGLPDVARTFAETPSGLVLLTGPTGAGKSTTLASLIDHVNQI